jgi:O-antigen/teichoic acid export membrane protein
MSGPFVGRVAGVFATKIVLFGIGLLTTYLLARTLGPDGRGAYYLMILLPTTLLTLGQLGIPSALVFMAGRGRSLDGLRTAAAALAILLAVATVVPAIVLLDLLRSTVLRGTTISGTALALAAVPFLFVSMFTSALLLGRQALGLVNALSLGQTVASAFLLLALVVGAGWGVDGAVSVYLLVGIGGAAAGALAVFRLARFDRLDPSLVRPVLSYGMRIYPGTLASFFSYRADVFLISIILGTTRAVGLYGVAVSLAELLFYVPDSIATAFFPKIAASTREDANRLVQEVNRMTVLLTIGAGVALVPAVAIGIVWLLPAFTESIPVIYVLLPGIVSLSVSKVLSGYVSGLGRPTAVGVVAVTSLIINLVANLVLIPMVGIVGAALASAISYTSNACMMVILVRRLTGASPAALLVPRRADIRQLANVLRPYWSRRQKSRQSTTAVAADDHDI